MGQVNAMIIDLVETILASQNKLEDDTLFNQLMDNLLNDTKSFWEKYKDSIPKKYYPLFRKVSAQVTK